MAIWYWRVGFAINLEWQMKRVKRIPTWRKLWLELEIEEHLYNILRHVIIIGLCTTVNIFRFVESFVNVGCTSKLSFILIKEFYKKLAVFFSMNYGEFGGYSRWEEGGEGSLATWNFDNLLFFYKLSFRLVDDFVEAILMINITLS